MVKPIDNVGRVIAEDPAVRDRIKVVFLPNDHATLSERLIPASDVSEQISKAGYEASGPGSMKFMMKRALGFPQSLLFAILIGQNQCSQGRNDRFAGDGQDV